MNVITAFNTLQHRLEKHGVLLNSNGEFTTQQPDGDLYADTIFTVLDEVTGIAQPKWTSCGNTAIYVMQNDVLLFDTQPELKLYFG